MFSMARNWLTRITRAVAAGAIVGWGGSAAAQFVYPPVAATGPHVTRAWQGGFNLGTAASGTYSRYLVVTDWFVTSGNQWSSEARATLHGGPLGAAPGVSVDGPSNSGVVYLATPSAANGSATGTAARTNMFWTGTLATPFVATGSAPLYLSTRQTFASTSIGDNTARWTNLRVVLDPVIQESITTIGAPLPAAVTDLGTLTVGATNLTVPVSNLTTGVSGINWYRFGVDSPVDSARAFDLYTSVATRQVDTRLSLFRGSSSGLLPVASTDDMNSQLQAALSFGSADNTQFQRPSYQGTNPGWFDGRGGNTALSSFGPADGYYATVPGAARLAPGDTYYLAVAQRSGARIDVVASSTMSLGIGGTATLTGSRTVGYSSPDSALGTGDVLLSIKSQPADQTLVWYGDGVVPGGGGTWNTSGLTWWNGSSLQTWDPNRRAVFSGSGGTVTVSPGITAGAGIQFLAPGYTVAGGTLTLTGSGPGAAFVAVGSGFEARINAEISGTGGLTKNGSGHLVLTGSNRYTTGTRVTGGTLTIGSGGLSGFIEGGIEIGPNCIMTFDRSGRLVLSGDTFGEGELRVLGTGTVVFTGDVGHTGGTTIAAGMLAVGGGGVTGDVGGIVTILPGATLALDRSDAFALSAEVEGTGTLLQRGSGSTTIAGMNTFFSGTAVVQRGRLIVTDPDGLGTATAIRVAAGATIDLAGSTGGYLLGEGRSLAGAGTIAGSVAFGAGSTLSPGDLTAPVMVAFAVVPEPTAVATASLGGLAWFLLRLKKRSSGHAAVDPRKSCSSSPLPVHVA
jgi:autotransporter-associated beta strand protein